MDNKIKEYCKSIIHLKTERLKAKKIYDFIMNDDNYSDASKAVYLSKTKKYLESINYFKNKKLYYKIGDKPLYNQLKEQQANNRENHIIEEIDYNIIDEINGWKIDNNIYKQYAYLLLQSGLRLNELYKNTITYLDETKINVKYISKKRIEDNKIYVVNLLIPSKDFINLYDKIQKAILEDNISLDSIRKTSEYHLKKIDKRLNNHTLRKLYIYIQIHYNKFMNHLIPSQRVKILLNHNGENISVFYNDTIKII